MCKKESQGNLEGQGKKLQLTPMYLSLQFDDKIMNSFLKNVLSTEQLQCADDRRIEDKHDKTLVIDQCMADQTVILPGPK